MMAAAAKADALKDQHEEEQAKFDNCQVYKLTFLYNRCSYIVHGIWPVLLLGLKVGSYMKLLGTDCTDMYLVGESGIVEFFCGLSVF